jgi:TIR domain
VEAFSMEMSSSSANDSRDFAFSRRWILVAGTGLEVGVPEADILAARAVGEELAKHQYGLVTGAWHGVDYIVTESFLNQLCSLSLDPNDYLIQVIPEDWQPFHKKGHVIRTTYGGREWLEPQKYADAVIMIGGRGGTYRTWLGALHDGIPRFPFGGTCGDAESAFHQTLDLWELIPVPGITSAAFEKLGRRISSESDAKGLAQYLVGELLWRSLNAVDALSRGSVDGAASLFISYSRKDSAWVTRLRTLMRPAERRGVISTWTDADIEPGKRWEPQLLGRLETTQAALLLVSNNLLESQYVRNVEMPALMKRMPDSRFHLFWVLLEPCDWRSLRDLEAVQAIGGVETAVNQSPTKADEQCRLIEIVQTLTRAISLQDVSELKRT